MDNGDGEHGKISEISLEHPQELSELMLKLQFGDEIENFVKFDDELDTFDRFEPEGDAKQRMEMDNDDSKEPHGVLDEGPTEEEEKNCAKPFLTNRQAIEALDSLKDYAISKNFTDMLKPLNLVEKSLQDGIISVKKQTLITGFFDKV